MRMYRGQCEVCFKIYNFCRLAEDRQNFRLIGTEGTAPLKQLEIQPIQNAETVSNEELTK